MDALSLVITLNIGFSVIAAVVLLGAYLFFLDDMEKTTLGRITCATLLGALAGMQVEHLRFIQTGAELFDSMPYYQLVLSTPVSFYFFSKEVLLPENRKSPWQLIHLVPLALSFFLEARIVAPFAFAIGAGYALWFTRFVYGMRRQKNRFRFEMFFFGLFAVMAVMVLVLGFSIPWMDPAIFYYSYAIAIGLALMLVVAALIVFPEIRTDVSDRAKLAYATSTLGGVDIDAKVRELERLMLDEKVFQNENLNLGTLADMLGLSSHQLSELINSKFSIGFSRYVREQRISEAKRLLASDDRSSVLSISLMTGFRSQSNFYAAFREITGEAPGTWRKKAKNSES
ncbi:MAG: helix-turn-helix domain-containing protein [Woeseiaceae bacterium]|nr:helix-turn-helix domain-containing protein [Woeseiaceae bacterium]